MQYLSAFRYATLVWLAGLLGLPIMFVLYSTLYSRRNFVDSLYGDRWDLIGFVSDLAPWSIPSWLIFIWATYAVCQNDWGVWRKKWRLFWQGLLLILVPNIFANNASRFFEITYVMLIYWSPALFSVFLFRLPTSSKLETPT